MAPHGEALDSSAGLQHLADAAMQGSHAHYLRSQYQCQGSTEGMVDAAIRAFRGEAMR